MAKVKAGKKSPRTGKSKDGGGKYRFTHLKKVNIRNVFVHSLKTQ